LRPVMLVCLAWLLSACVTTSPNQKPNEGVGETLKTLVTNAATSVSNTAGNFAAAGAGGSSEGGNLLQMLAQSVGSIDEPREIEIGRQLAAVLLGAKPMHADMKLQLYVNQLGRWISLQSARPQLPWTFVVLADSGVNAFAAPGGYVFVTKGLIDQVQSEAELAGVLAHEIVHVNEKHHLKSLNKTARAQLASMVLAKQLNGKLGNDITNQLMNLGRDVYSKGLDRDDEFEADRKGVVLAARAGLDPYGLPFMVQQLGAMRADNPAYALMFSTHPPTTQRLEFLEKAMGSRLDVFAGAPLIKVSHRLEPAKPEMLVKPDPRKK